MNRGGRLTLAACQQVRLAVTLIDLGARRVLVQHLTRLPRTALRPLYRDLRRPAPGGPLPSQLAACVQPRRRQLHATLFAALYQRQATTVTVDPTALVQDYQRYQPFAPSERQRLDLSTAWLVAQALSADWLRLQPCAQCGAPSLVATVAVVARCGVCGERQTAQSAPRSARPVTAEPERALPPAGIRSLADCQALELAVTLVNLGLRGVLVQLATGLSGHAIAALYRSIHGRPPPAGPLPAGTGSLLRRSRQHLHAALLAVLYQHGHTPPGSGGIDYPRLIQAYQVYCQLAPATAYRLDSNDAWVIARDLSARLAYLSACPDCATPFLRLADASRLPQCPACTLVRPIAIRPGTRQTGLKPRAFLTG
ncbi:MAG: FlhC family transcriptional regulator [Candidatus Competibacteraceae bacterium]